MKKNIALIALLFFSPVYSMQWFGNLRSLLTNPLSFSRSIFFKKSTVKQADREEGSAFLGLLMFFPSVKSYVTSQCQRAMAPVRNLEQVLNDVLDATTEETKKLEKKLQATIEENKRLRQEIGKRSEERDANDVKRNQEFRDKLQQEQENVQNDFKKISEKHKKLSLDINKIKKVAGKTTQYIEDNGQLIQKLITASSMPDYDQDRKKRLTDVYLNLKSNCGIAPTLLSVSSWNQGW